VCAQITGGFHRGMENAGGVSPKERPPHRGGQVNPFLKERFGVPFVVFLYDREHALDAAGVE